MVPEQTVVTIARRRHVITGYQRNRGAHRVAGRCQGRFPLPDQLHADCEHRVKEEKFYAGPDNASEVALSCTGCETVAAEAEQNHTESSGQICLDEGEEQLDRDDQKRGSNNERQHPFDEREFKTGY